MRIFGPCKLTILACFALSFCAGLAVEARAVEVKAAVIRVDNKGLLPISRLDLPPDDLGFAGAVLATEDNQTTGKFLGFDFQTETLAVTAEAAPGAIADLRARGVALIVLLANGEETLAMADAAGPDALVLNARARDDRLREEDCRANLLHVAPTRSMLTDGLMQFLMWKKWTRLFLIHGSHPEDALLAEAYRHSARKFGAKIVEEREFTDRGGARVSDSGHVLVQRQIPVFTQGAEDHDVVLAADESDVFAPYLPYHTWDARPVVGSAGLRPVSWHAAMESWGATQFQGRFERISGRPMREEDYQAWLALRVIGEAVSRTGKADPASLRAYALSDAFELAAFKGQKLTFRTWNGQMRQPILLSDRTLTVSVSPQEGFLHQSNLLDTLGRDRPETACTAFGDIQ